MIGSCGPGSGGGCDTPVLVKVQVTVSSAAKVMEAVAVPGPVTGGAVVGKELVAGPEQLRGAVQPLATGSASQYEPGAGVWRFPLPAGRVKAVGEPTGPEEGKAKGV